MLTAIVLQFQLLLFFAYGYVLSLSLSLSPVRPVLSATPDADTLPCS
jgi:hypothetical protein